MDMQTTVLVAEDSRTQAAQIQRLLEKAGLRAVMAINGREALDLIRRSPPDVVVTDLEMPEMNGLELVEAVHAEFPKIPIVLATAVGSEAIAAEALRKGAASYVPKQFMHDLIPTVQRLLAVVQAVRASAQLAACASMSEVRFCLSNTQGLVGPLVAQVLRMLERFCLRDANEALRVAMALEEALQNAFIHGNLEVSSKLREEAGSVGRSPRSRIVSRMSVSVSLRTRPSSRFATKARASIPRPSPIRRTQSTWTGRVAAGCG